MSKHYGKLNSIAQVAQFHETFNHPILDSPAIPSSERAELRVKLIQEELDELSQAIKDGDLVEVADALCDLQYVLSGAVLEFGLGSRFVELFNEVQRSNMSKACSTRDIAAETQSYYDAVEKVKTFVEEKGGLFIVKRESDDKILKSRNYSPAVLDKIIFEEKYLEDYQVRVIEEKAELDERIEKLQSYLNSSKAEEIDFEESDRMKYQLNAMRDYSNVLNSRIQNF